MKKEIHKWVNYRKSLNFEDFLPIPFMGDGEFVLKIVFSLNEYTEFQHLTIHH